MNEIVMKVLAIPRVSATHPIEFFRKSRRGFYGYSLLATLTMVGWLARDVGLVDPAHGFGYWLGIIGSSMMLVLLLYPSVKKLALSRSLGLAKHWFHVHVIFGLVGPLLILYHCNFQFDAFNSKFALYCMLAVAVSGIIGKHIYARIHADLYGHCSSMEELRTELSMALEKSDGLAVWMPNFVKELHKLSDELQGDEITKSIDIRRSLIWTVKPVFVRLRLYRLIYLETAFRAKDSAVLSSNIKGLRRSADAYASKYVRLMRRVAQFSLYERLFSLWHLFHLPLFLLLVISASFHVLAVHMY
jgi:hypothetical protein